VNGKIHCAIAVQLQLPRRNHRYPYPLLFSYSQPKKESMMHMIHWLMGNTFGIKVPTTDEIRYTRTVVLSFASCSACNNLRASLLCLFLISLCQPTKLLTRPGRVRPLFPSLAHAASPSCVRLASLSPMELFSRPFTTHLSPSPSISSPTHPTINNGPLL
jgi:hypothetical protein